MLAIHEIKVLVLLSHNSFFSFHVKLTYSHFHSYSQIHPLRYSFDNCVQYGALLLVSYIFVTCYFCECFERGDICFVFAIPNPITNIPSIDWFCHTYNSPCPFEILTNECAIKTNQRKNSSWKPKNLKNQVAMSQQKSKTTTIDTKHYTSHLYGILNRFVHVEYVSSNTNIIKCFLCIGYWWFIGNDVWRFHLNYLKIILYFTFSFIWSHRHYSYPYRNTNPNGKSECKTLSPIWNKSILWLLNW